MYEQREAPNMGPLLAKGLACMRHVIPEASFTCCLQMLQQLLYTQPALMYFALCKIRSTSQAA